MMFYVAIVLMGMVIGYNSRTWPGMIISCFIAGAVAGATRAGFL
jgi:hypothetical protein